jgi:hypothetical protein
MGLRSTFLSPRDDQQVSVTVYPEPGDSIRSAYFLFSGDLFVDSVPLPLEGDEPQIGYVDFTVPVAPLTGTVYVKAVVTTKTRRGSADTLFSIGDDGPPLVSSGAVWDTVSPGSTVPILCTGWDRGGLKSARAEAHGAVDTVFTSADATHPQGLMLYGGAFVPASTPLGAVVTVLCAMTDIYDHEVRALDSVVVTLPP